MAAPFSHKDLAYSTLADTETLTVDSDQTGGILTDT